MSVASTWRLLLGRQQAQASWTLRRCQGFDMEVREPGSLQDLLDLSWGYSLAPAWLRA